MSKPAVCFVHGDALDLFRGENGPRFGGSETQVYLLARLLANSAEFDVRLIADKDVAGAQYPGVTFRSAIPAVQRGVPYISRFVNRARLRRPYEGLHDAALVQTILGPYTESTWRTARELGLKFVYRMSCDADIDGSFFPAETRSRYHAALCDADGVMAQSESQKLRLQSELGMESTVVRSIVEIPPEGPASGGSYVLWAGRAAPIKRPWIMVETARVMPDTQFVMLMPPEAHVHGELFMRFVTQEAASVPNLKVVPGVSYFEMARYYREAALFASTSAIEGVPSAFLQAGAQGTPVVSLEVDPEGMLGEGGLGFCADGDINRFREAIATYMADSGLVRGRGSTAFEYVKQYHSAEVVGPILAQFLRSVFAR